MGLVRALDLHLRLVEDSARKVVAGDDAYLKLLAAELRVLVCRSSSNEGLLWRLCSALGVSDSVHAHAACKVDREHPLAEGLTVVILPLQRAGLGDPRLPARHHSLKHIIRNCEAVFIDGRGYSHEQLIKAESRSKWRRPNGGSSSR